MIQVHAMWSLRANITQQTKQSVNWMNRSGNIMFHFNQRGACQQIVMNTKTGSWGQEERIGLDTGILRAGITTPRGYEVYIGDDLKHIYRHRISWSKFDRIGPTPESWTLTAASSVDEEEIDEEAASASPEIEFYPVKVMQNGTWKGHVTNTIP